MPVFVVLLTLPSRYSCLGDFLTYTALSSYLQDTDSEEKYV